jgi:anaerobic sulfite reductase subunit A
MGYLLTEDRLEQAFSSLQDEYKIFAPVKKHNYGRFSGSDAIIYDFVRKPSEIVFDEKSDYAFKEAFLPLSETLFFFTEDQVKEADKRPCKLIVFLRSCDMHAVKRLDEIYLHNGPEDYYYKRLRENTVFVIMGCEQAFETCFCVDMGTNRYDDYAVAMNKVKAEYWIDCKDEKWNRFFAELAKAGQDFTPAFVASTEVSVSVPENLTDDVLRSSIWDEYDSRCINCGRCNFVCPTCTCFTMQDIFYADTTRAGERRRVSASCMVDGFTDVAGGGAYRKENGQRMRFRVLHKLYDYKKRFGYHMCVGCGRCDDVCPEYISIAGAAGKLEQAMKEVQGK